MDIAEGGYFGDMEIITKQLRQNTLISVLDCDILALSRQAFEEVIVVEYPDVYKEMVLLAEQRAIIIT